MYDLSYSHEEGKEGMVMTHRPKKEITCYDDWIKAWDTDAIIYLKHQGNAHKHQQMTTYVENLRVMREEKLNWLLYDHRFHWDRLRYGSCIPQSGEIRQDLMNDSLIARMIHRPFEETVPEKPEETLPSQTPAKGEQKSKKKPGFIPKSFCFNFHNPSKTCTAGKDCTYRHECPRCYDGTHTAYKCPNKGKSGKPNKQKRALKKKSSNSN